MYDFCPEHGERLLSIGDFTKFWCRVYRCPAPNCPGYIEVSNPNWLPLLIRLDIGVLPKLEASSQPVIEEAFGRIKQIDYKTVSTVFFEHTLLGCYRKREEYRVLYPDGSDGHFS